MSSRACILLLALLLNACGKPNSEDTVFAPQLPQLEKLAVNESSIAEPDNASIESAYERKQSNVQVSGSGKVVKLLADDTQGTRHQKFLVRINPQQTLLFAHNIDLAAKIPLQLGDEITFSGEYVYNPKGGVMHWTHLDPHGDHPSGWVMLRGNKYQ
ncbi:MAG: DUF3465 domain-containing protein [Methylotenera sp.]|nr:DUF3465 domain-containing protein [Methylotenera sp.]